MALAFSTLCSVTMFDMKPALHYQGPRADGLKQKRDRHKFHIKHLEMAMRAVDNDALGVEQVWRKTTLHIRTPFYMQASFGVSIAFVWPFCNNNSEELNGSMT